MTISSGWAARFRTLSIHRSDRAMSRRYVTSLNTRSRDSAKSYRLATNQDVAGSSPAGPASYLSKTYGELHAELRLWGICGECHIGR